MDKGKYNKYKKKGKKTRKIG